MEEIKIIYHNKYGISFYWKGKEDKIQIVFRDTGFHLNLEELKAFQKNVIEVAQQACCAKCPSAKKCKSLLLKTPSEKIDLAVSAKEIEDINDLLGGSIFKLEMNNYLNNLSCN